MSDIYSKVIWARNHLSRTILGSSLKTSGKNVIQQLQGTWKRRKPVLSHQAHQYACTQCQPPTPPSNRFSFFRLVTKKMGFGMWKKTRGINIKGYSSSPRIRSNRGWICQEGKKKDPIVPAPWWWHPALVAFQEEAIFDWKKIWFRMPTASSVRWDEAVEFLYVLCFGHRFGEVVIKTQWSW